MKELRPDEEVTISVERMVRFCLLVETTKEFSRIKSQTINLPPHLTRFGTLLFVTAGFLYSLFESESNSVNIARTWTTFDNPFAEEIHEIERQLEPFRQDLKTVRNRVSFHGSTSRTREMEGLDIFNPTSGRGQRFVDLLANLQNIAERMIEWYCDQEPEGSDQLRQHWQAIVLELKGYEIRRRDH